MSRGMKIGLVVGGAVIVLPVMAIAVLFAAISLLPETASKVMTREMHLANQGSLIIDGNVHGRSEHGTSQRAGYRAPGSSEIEWFGDVSDGVEPGVYFSGALVVVIDAPSACLFVRNPKSKEKWKTLALVFPNDIGPFPVAWYAERNGLTIDEVSRINELGGKRERKYPTTYIQGFEPGTRDLKCSYWVDNKSAWPLQFRLSEDGTRLALVEIGKSSF